MVPLLLVRDHHHLSISVSVYLVFCRSGCVAVITEGLQSGWKRLWPKYLQSDNDHDYENYHDDDDDDDDDVDNDHPHPLHWLQRVVG